MLKPRGNSLDDSMTAFGCFSEVGVALGHGGRSSLLPLALVAVETHRKVILKKGWLPL